jgi:hypothetical protein
MRGPKTSGMLIAAGRIDVELHARLATDPEPAG